MCCEYFITFYYTVSLVSLSLFPLFLCLSFVHIIYFLWCCWITTWFPVVFVYCRDTIIRISVAAYKIRFATLQYPCVCNKTAVFFFLCLCTLLRTLYTLLLLLYIHKLYVYAYMLSVYVYCYMQRNFENYFSKPKRKFSPSLNIALDSSEINLSCYVFVLNKK